jgi:hypothetical protein
MMPRPPQQRGPRASIILNADRLRDARVQARLTQELLAESASVGIDVVRRAERRNGPPRAISYENAWALAQVFAGRGSVDAALQYLTEVGRPARVSSVQVIVPNRLDFRTLVNPFTHDIGVWKRAPLAISIIPLKVEMSGLAQSRLRLRSLLVRLPQFHEHETYRWLYEVDFNKASTDWLACLQTVKEVVIDPGGLYEAEVLCRVADQASTHWEQFFRAAPYMAEGCLRVEATLLLQTDTDGPLTITREWKIDNAAIQACVNRCAGNPEGLCRFMQPSVISRGKIE